MTIVLTQLQGLPITSHSSGDIWEIRAGVAFSGNYITGGDATLAAEVEKILGEVGTGKLTWLDVQGDTGGYVLEFNYETGKLKVYRTGAAVKGVLEELPEEAYPAALTAAKVRVLAMGY